MINEQIHCSTRCIAKELAGHLEDQQKKIVFAESCTAGLASGILAGIPGISRFLCGSAVTYQETTKEQWLNIDPDQISKYTAVSPEVTRAMATSVLEKTPQADFSVAITGHLERNGTPHGPRVFVVVSWRTEDDSQSKYGLENSPRRCFLLHQKDRISRQWEAARCALHLALEYLRFSPTHDRECVNWERICLAPINYRWKHWY